jgi:Lsr2
MASTQDRDELRRLSDELLDDAVHGVLGVARIAAMPVHDGSTVSFALDGASYEIDLDADNAERPRQSLVEWFEHVQSIRRRSRSTVEPAEAGDVRNGPVAPERPAWIGAGHLGPDYASRAKEVLRDEMGQQEA